MVPHNCECRPGNVNPSPLFNFCTQGEALMIKHILYSKLSALLSQENSTHVFHLCSDHQ